MHHLERRRPQQDALAVEVVNAVAQAAKNGVAIEGSEIYVTASPCLTCFKLIANSGIRTVFYKEFYRDVRITNYAQEANIRLVYMGSDTTGT